MAKKQKRDEKGYLRKSFTDSNGKRHFVRAKTEDELLEKYLKRKAEEAEKAKNIQEDIFNPRIDDYYKTFTDIRRNEIKESTIRAQISQYQNISNVILAPGKRFGDLRLKDITRANIERARQMLLNDGKTPENLNICFAHLNHVFQSAVLDDTLEKNPCRALKKLKRSKKPATDTKHRALTVEETMRFFQAAKDRNSFYTNVFKLMIKTGMRIGEISALYLTDIDTKEGFIHVRRTVSRDELGAYYISEDTKTESGSRDIPLTQDVLNIIKSQEELNRQLFGLQWSGTIFKSTEEGLLREYTLNREIKRICKDAEIEYFTSHAFRDTFATRFIEQRPQDYKVLSEILGHKDISITLNLYTHVMTETKVNAMNDILIKIG